MGRIKSLFLKSLVAVLMAAIIMPSFVNSVYADEKPIFPGEVYCEVDLSPWAYQYGGTGFDEEPLSEAEATTEVDVEGFKAAIIDGINRHESVVFVDEFNITTKNVNVLYVQILNEHPEFFYMHCVLGFWCTGEDVTRVQLKYDMSERDIDEFNRILNNFMATIDPSWSDFDKILYVHDYIVLNTCYAYEELNNNSLNSVPHVFSAYGVFVNGYAVCAGYALAFRMVMQKLGIPCEYIVGNDGKHAWNEVCLNGQWYQLDATWDDPTWNAQGRVGHNNFLVSDARMKANGHRNWEDYHVCTDGSLDSAWWTGVNSQIYLYNGSYYYMKSTGSGYSLYKRTNGEETYLGITVKNKINKITYGYYSTPVYMTAANGKLYYYASTQLFEYDIEAGEERVVYALRDGSCIEAASVFATGDAHITTYGMPDDDFYVINIYENPNPTGTCTPIPTNTSRPTSTPTSTPVPTSTSTPVPTSTPTATPIPVYSAAGFASRLYTSALDRDAENEGVDYWVSALSEGVTGAEAAHVFLFGSEITDSDIDDIEFVRRLYRTFMGREGSPVDVGYWYSLILDEGYSRQVIFDSFVNTQEWADICYLSGIESGSDIVSTYYVEATPSPTAGASSAGGSGADLPNVDVPEIEVPEVEVAAAREFVTRLYTECLGREADQAGVDYWADEIVAGNYSGTDVAWMFFGCDEFTSANYDNYIYVMRIYATLMDRPAYLDEVSYWAELLDFGIDREVVFISMATSSEFSEILSGLLN